MWTKKESNLKICFCFPVQKNDDEILFMLYTMLTQDDWLIFLLRHGPFSYFTVSFLSGGLDQRVEKMRGLHCTLMKHTPVVFKGFFVNTYLKIQEQINQQ